MAEDRFRGVFAGLKEIRGSERQGYSRRLLVPLASFSIVN